MPIFYSVLVVWLHLWKVWTVDKEAEAFLSCPTSSPVLGTTGQLSKCQQACL